MKGEREESVSRITSCLRDGETGVGDVFLLANVGVQSTNMEGKCGLDSSYCINSGNSILFNIDSFSHNKIKTCLVTLRMTKRHH